MWFRFPKASRPSADAQAVDNPYTKARLVWMDHVGRLVSEAALLRVVTLFSLTVAVGSVAGLVKVSTAAKFIPYVVEVDRAGNVEAVQRAMELDAASRPMLEAQVERFITLARRVTPDMALQGAAVRGVFAMVAYGDPALAKLESYFGGVGHPYERAARVTVSTEIQSVVPQSDRTWQVDWIERVHSRSGELKDEFGMRALLDVYQTKPKESAEAELRANPLGIFIRDFNWSRRQNRGPQ